MTSENTIAEEVSRRGNILIEESLTPMQKLTIYLALTGVLFLRSVSFYYQEADYADPDHPQHKHYNDTVISKRVNLVAAILVFMWYFYSTFFIEPFYHKYVTRRLQLRTEDNNSSPGQQDRQQQLSEEENTPETAGRLYDKPSQKTKVFHTMDMRNPKIPFDARVVDEQTVLFESKEPMSNRDFLSNAPRSPKLPLPKKMTLDEYFEWRSREMYFKEIEVRKESE